MTAREPGKPGHVGWVEWLFPRHYRGFSRPQHYAIPEERWRRAPKDEIRKIARDRAAILWRRQGLYGTPKPIIRVFRAQGKPLFVYRIGGLFFSSFTWDRPALKIARTPPKKIESTTLSQRWKE